MNPRAGDAQDTEAVGADATAVFLKEPGPSLTALSQRSGTDSSTPHASPAPGQLQQTAPPVTPAPPKAWIAQSITRKAHAALA